MSPAPADHLSVRSLRAVLFDLDGTLLDTVADISLALNRALAEQKLASLPAAQVRVLIGRGVPTLIERALARLGAAGESSAAAHLVERFHFHYERIHELDEIQTRVYPGVTAGLAELHALGLGLAVVTNKPNKAAVDLLTRLGLSQWIDVVVGGDSGAHRKPHPQPLLTACEELAVRPVQALMVGDSLTDVLAARAAGLAVVCVPYGYNEGVDPRALPCDAFVESVGALPALLTAAHSRRGATAPADATERAPRRSKRR
jgi:phosphoglycolate phosphatase